MPRRAPTTFISATGPHLNIGDALIRRQAVRWAAKQNDSVVAYVGSSPASWEEQLEIPADAVVLRGKSKAPEWIFRALTAPRGSTLVFEPGEVPLSRGNTKRELVFLMMTIAFRLHGGLVIRPPRAVRQHALIPRSIHKLACRVSSVTLWRDRLSLELMHIGRLVPDIGFAEQPVSGLPGPDRKALIISMRGDRPYPELVWLDGIRNFTQAHGLNIQVVTQVLEDDRRGEQLAKALGGRHFGWDGTEPVAHEASLRERYGTARLIVSDRLHVLILGALSGAVPCEIVARPQPKVQSNFETIGYATMSCDTEGADPVQVFLECQLDRQAELIDRVSEARRSLSETASAITRQHVQRRRNRRTR